METSFECVIVIVIVIVKLFFYKKSTQSGLLATCPMCCLRRRPRCGCPVFSGLDDCAWTGISIRGSHCWPQSELSEMLLGCTEERESLWHWVSENCGKFREMQMVRHAKFIGTMTGRDGYLHRWTAPRKIHSARDENQCFNQKFG